MPQFYVSEKHVEGGQPYVTFVEFEKSFFLGRKKAAKKIETIRSLDKQIAAARAELSEISEKERTRANVDDRIRIRQQHEAVFNQGLAQLMKAKHEVLEGRPIVMGAVPESHAKVEVGHVIKKVPKMQLVLHKGPHPATVPAYSSLFTWPNLPERPAKQVLGQNTQAPKKKISETKPPTEKMKLPALDTIRQKKPSAVHREPARAHVPDAPVERTLPHRTIIREKNPSAIKPLQPLKPREPHIHRK